jgi:hypothetical protein
MRILASVAVAAAVSLAAVSGVGLAMAASADPAARRPRRPGSRPRR